MQWDFKNADTNEDVFVNIDGETRNMIELIKGNERTVLRPNPLNPGTYTVCLTASAGEPISKIADRADKSAAYVTE